VARTSSAITHEEIFRETRDWCVRNSKTCRTIYERKFFYLFTCEYCFSHYVTATFLVITCFKLPDARATRLFNSRFRSGVGGEYLYEHFCQAVARH